MGIYLNPRNDRFKQALNSAIYVDKSGLISVTIQRIHTEQKYICVSRPRRFGKSVNLGMLAEIRKYGESLIIVDQIPNKLTPEVLKNTNTKIIHRLFAADDKDAVDTSTVTSQDSWIPTTEEYTPGISKEQWLNRPNDESV